MPEVRPGKPTAIRFSSCGPMVQSFIAAMVSAGFEHVPAANAPLKYAIGRPEAFTVTESNTSC